MKKINFRKLKKMAESDLDDVFDQTDEAEVQLRKRTFAKVKENSFKVSRRNKHKIALISNSDLSYVMV